MNLAELEQLTDALVKLGYTYVPAAEHTQHGRAGHVASTVSAPQSTVPEPVEIAIVNTCTVTQSAAKKSWRLMRRLAEGSGIEFLFMTGCYTHLEPNLKERLQQYAVKSVIVAQADKAELPTIIERTVRRAYGYEYKTQHRTVYDDPFEAFKHSRSYAGAMLSSQGRFYGHRRALIKVQDGCNVFCTYCCIPFARGAPRSRPVKDILSQLTELVKQGVQELVLTGINLSAYHDKVAAVSFTDLVAICLQTVGDDVQVRLSSLEPHGLGEEFFKLLEYPNLSPHLHLPLQGTSERVLRAMGRRYTLSQYMDIVKELYARNPQLALSTDVITGFPGESDAEFTLGLDVLRACKFFKLHVFPFSYRPFSKLASETERRAAAGVKNAQGALPAHEPTEQVAADIKRARAQTLRALSVELEQTKLKQLQSQKQRFILETLLSETETREFCALTADLPASAQIARIPGDVYVFTGTSEYYVKGRVIIPKALVQAQLGLSSAADALGSALQTQLIHTTPAVFTMV